MHRVFKPHTLQFSLVGSKTDSRILFDEYLDNKVSISVSTFNCLEETRLVESTQKSMSGRAWSVCMDDGSPLVINNVTSELGDE